MNYLNKNELWCRCIVKELLHCGLTHAIALGTGGRSAMMALVLGSSPQLKTTVHTDERSGAFMALGTIKATRRPVAVCTTSGTAVANLLPATVEADACNLPLILLTCDRPRWQRGAGAPQSTDQIGLCAAVVRGSVDLEDPQDDEESLLKLRRQVRGLLRHCLQPDVMGPIQINIPLSGRLISTEVDPNWQLPPLSATALEGRPWPDGRSRPLIDWVAPQPTETELDNLAKALGLRPGLKGLIVAGPDCHLSFSQVEKLTAITGYPLLADAPSNLRRPAVSPNLVCEADALVFNPVIALSSADLIIRLGSAPISHTLHSYLSRQKCPVLRIDSQKIDRDFLSPQFHLLQNPDDRVLQVLAEKAAPGDLDWLALWLNASRSSREYRQSLVAKLPWGECQAAATICNADGFDLLHLANSMTVRHGNLHCGPSTQPQSIFVNRGVNGIDGTIGTFIGELTGSQQRGLLLIGDQSMLHDLPALEATRRPGLGGAIVIVNNKGGAIFDLLGCTHLPRYQELVRNPHDVNFAAIATSFGLSFQRCTNAAELAEALKVSRMADGITVVEVVVPPDSLARDLPKFYQPHFH